MRRRLDPVLNNEFDAALVNASKGLYTFRPLYASTRELNKPLQPMSKPLKLSNEQIQPLAEGRGLCIASDMITVEGLPVGFMYRGTPDHAADSGWRFLSGFESDEDMSDASKHGVYDVNTIANYDPSIIPLLDSPEGIAYEKPPGAEQFAPVSDWDERKES